MLWNLNHGNSSNTSEDFLAAVAKKRGKTVKALEEKPEMTPDICWYLDVFFLLSNSRQMGFSGAGPIPFSEITNYTNYFELITDDLMEFCTIVVKMDEAYLSFIKEKSESKTKATPKGTSRR